MNTFRESWDDFERRVYPDGMTDEQRKQIHRAYYAGAVALLSLTEKLADPKVSDAEVLERVQSIGAEIKDEVDRILGTIKSRN